MSIKCLTVYMKEINGCKILTFCEYHLTLHRYGHSVSDAKVSVKGHSFAAVVHRAGGEVSNKVILGLQGFMKHH